MTECVCSKSQQSERSKLFSLLICPFHSHPVCVRVCVVWVISKQCQDRNTQRHIDNLKEWLCLALSSSINENNGFSSQGIQKSSEFHCLRMKVQSLPWEHYMSSQVSQVSPFDLKEVGILFKWGDHLGRSFPVFVQEWYLVSDVVALLLLAHWFLVNDFNLYPINDVTCFNMMFTDVHSVSCPGSLLFAACSVEITTRTTLVLFLLIYSPNDTCPVVQAHYHFNECRRVLSTDLFKCKWWLEFKLRWYSAQASTLWFNVVDIVLVLKQSC